MLRTFVAFLCFCFALPAFAKLGETVPQLVKRFGKSYTIESDANGKTYRFRSEKVSVDVLVSNGVSAAETYFSDHPLTANGEPPNDIVRAVLRTNAPQVRWVELDGRSLGADYALESADHKYVAVLRYSGPQPEGMVWTMTVGLLKIVRSQSITAAPANAASPTPAAGSTPSPVIPESSSAPTARPFDPEAYLQCAKGFDYYNGDGVEKDFVKAVELFRKSAERNYAPAQAALGFCYSAGQGVPKNDEEAVKWFQKASEQNLGNAQYNLTVHYRDGRGVPKNGAEAVKWFRKAAEQKLPTHSVSLASATKTGLEWQKMTRKR